jgi:FkbH-like protein
VEAFRAGLPLALTVGPFGQFEQELQGESLRRPDTRAVVILMRPEDVDPGLERASPEAMAERLARLEERLVALVEGVRASSGATVVVANAALRPSASGALTALDQALGAHNAALARRLSALSDCHVFDWNGAVAAYGADRFEDPRLWYLARVSCGQEAGAFVSQRLGRRLASLLAPRAKCVVLDLDDTLWGGVIGDDGVEGLKLGDEYPGRAFKDFQQRLKALTHQGIVLAIASKNDESTAREAFTRHPEMILRWEDFACHRISWGPKDEAIRQIAAELNLGLDSFIFLDDNPVECAAVARSLPEVQVHCLGRDPLAFRAILDGIASLDRPPLTREDADRTRMYQESRQRREHEQQHQGREEFLTSLQMTAVVAPADAVTLPRVAQLIEKTNQFNLTTRRHAPDVVKTMASDPAARVLTLRLSDVYGDLGLVCVGILRETAAATWTVDTFLMSCRVMGRGVEDAFLAYLGEQAAAAGARQLVGEYRPTAKNGIVKDFYSQHGFVARDGAFVIELTKGAIPWPAQVTRAP